jgi:hypothetical protein
MRKKVCFYRILGKSMQLRVNRVRYIRRGVAGLTFIRTAAFEVFVQRRGESL